MVGDDLLFFFNPSLFRLFSLPNIAKPGLWQILKGSRARAFIRLDGSESTAAAAYFAEFVKNFEPSKKRLGRLNIEMKTAPCGACATWTLPPGRQTKFPAVTSPS